MAAVYYTDPEYCERLDGRDYPKVSPKSTHGFVQLGFGALLMRLAGKHARVITELRCKIGAVDGTDSHLVPDIAVITTGRWHSLITDADREEPPFAPDISIEIRSPGQRPSLRARKVARYLAAGAQLIFDVIPQSRTIDVYDADGCRHFTAADRFSDERFPWLAFEVAEVFAYLDDD